MASWMQIFGAILILGHLCMSSTSAAHAGRKRSFDDGKFGRVSERQGRLKNRRMMMGLGAEMDWGHGRPEFTSELGNRHLKHGRSVVTFFPRATESRLGAPHKQKLKSSAASKSASFRDSVIVLKNHKRSEGQRPSGPGSGGSELKSDSLRDSVIVLRNYKRTQGHDILPQADKHESAIVLKIGKRSEGNPSSQSIVRDPAIVLRSHKRSQDKQVDLSQDRTSRLDPISERSRSDSSQVLETSPKSTSSPPVSGSVIVLKDHSLANPYSNLETAAGH